MPVLEVMALAKTNDEPEAGNLDHQKHRQRLPVFFISLVEAKRVESIHWQAFERWRPRTKDRGSPFTDSSELGAILEARLFPWASKYPSVVWSVTYSGARVNEVAQLQVDDIATVDGVPGFYVRVVPGANGSGQAFAPFIPWRNPLEAGFLDYVGGQGRRPCAVVPPIYRTAPVWDLAQLSRQFSTYIKRQGVEERGRAFTVFTPWPIASTPRVRRQRP